MKKSVIAITLVGLLIGMGAGQVNASGYTFTDLGYGNATGINDVGQLVGRSYGGGTIWNGTTPAYRSGLRAGSNGWTSGDGLRAVDTEETRGCVEQVGLDVDEMIDAGFPVEEA
jgi:hypothetical protein